MFYFYNNSNSKKSNFDLNFNSILKFKNLLKYSWFLYYAVRIDRINPILWIGFQCAVLWPTWRWMAARLTDGSDDPFGIFALLFLLALLIRVRHKLSASPQFNWLGAGMVGALISTVLPGQVPTLIVSLIAILSLGCTIRAFLPLHIASLPVLGLATLALPLLSSLQFYLGYPLRILTAEICRWFLQILFNVERIGSSLVINGQWVIVDAPCSGVQMVWMGYFTACSVALWNGTKQSDFCHALPWVSIFVLFGNIIRNGFLLLLEAYKISLSEIYHNILGLIFLALVCGLIIKLILNKSKKQGGSE